MRIALGCLAAALALAGCGGDGGTARGDRPPADTGAPAQPEGAPPELDIAGPPPAWVETRRGAFWLAYASFCWEAACADYVAECDPRRVPTLDVSRGDELRFHLDFEPSRVSLAFYDPPIDQGPDTVRLETRRDPGWTVDRAGIVWVTATAGQGREASYAACLRLEGGADTGPGEALTIEEAIALATDDPVLVQGSLYIAGRETRLCSGFAESHPPQCAGPSLRVEGLVLAAVEGLLERSGDVRWSERPMTLRGTIAGDTLTVLEVES